MRTLKGQDLVSKQFKDSVSTLKFRFIVDFEQSIGAFGPSTKSPSAHCEICLSTFVSKEIQGKVSIRKMSAFQRPTSFSTLGLLVDPVAFQRV